MYSNHIFRLSVNTNRAPSPSCHISCSVDACVCCDCRASARIRSDLKKRARGTDEEDGGGGNPLFHRRVPCRRRRVTFFFSDEPVVWL